LVIFALGILVVGVEVYSFKIGHFVHRKLNNDWFWLLALSFWLLAFGS